MSDGRQDLENMLAMTLVNGGAELRVVPGKPPMCKMADGTYEPIEEAPVTNERVALILRSFLPPEHLALLDEKGAITFNGKVEDHKFRIRVKAASGNYALAAKPHVIATSHLTIDQSDGTRVASPGGQIKLGALKRNLIKSGGGRGELEMLLVTMEEYGASDLHLRHGHAPCYRVSGSVCPLDMEPYDSDHIRKILYEVLSPDQTTQFETNWDLDFAHATPEGARFRVNVFIERGTMGLVARRVSTKIPSYKALNLPPHLDQLPLIQQGVVLVCGITGSGKSTTLAATIEVINQTRPCNIVTLEDPIEYAYQSKKALIAQREIGIDVRTFEAGLKHVLRQDPDVILVGELRDSETFRTALMASETGHLVFGTLHSATVAQTMGRILEMFPTAQHEQVRRSLAFNLRAILCQKILPARDGGVVPAVEIMFCSPSAQKMIRESRDEVLSDVITGDDDMQDFNQSLHALIKAGLISQKVAFEHSPKPERLKMLIQGIRLSEDSRILG